MKDNKTYLAILLLLGGIWYFKKDKKVATVVSIQGCTDDTALNYNENANVSDDSCIYEDDDELEEDTPDVIGCMDSAANNYNSEANTDDGSCEYDAVVTEVMGCTDPTADNYNPDATTDDTSCSYICDDMDLDGVCDDDEIAGCTDTSATNYNALATDDDGSCQYEEVIEDIFGCADSAACNYDSAATADDGSCVFAEENYDCEGNCLNDADGDGVCDPYEVSGCTDVNSISYNPAATDDDGSCQYYELGCTNPDAENFNPDATEDDGTCIVTVSTQEQSVINYIIDVFLQSAENEGYDPADGYFEALVYLSPFYDFSAIAQSFGISGCGNDANDMGMTSDSCAFINELTYSSAYEDLIAEGNTFDDIFIPTIPVSQWAIAGASGCFVNPETQTAYDPYCVTVNSDIPLINTGGQYGNYQYTWQDWVDEYNQWMETGEFNPYVDYK
jgi:hypothetical protein